MINLQTLEFDLFKFTLNSKRITKITKNINGLKNIVFDNHTKCKIPKNLMNEGVYTIHRLMFVKDRGTVLFEHRNCFSVRILAKSRDFGWMGAKEEGIIDPKLNWEIQTD